MNAQTVIEPPPNAMPTEAPNWYAIYLEERERNKQLYSLLSDACMVLRNEADWRDRNGRDGGTLRGIANRIKTEALS